MSVSLLIADDHPVVRRGVHSILEAEPGWEVVAEAYNGEDAIRLAMSHQIDAVVLDVSMPGMTGLTAASTSASGVLSSRS